MFFRTGPKLKNITDTSMTFNNVEIAITDSYKYLGVMLDSKLRFDRHVNYMHSKIYPKLKMLGRIRCYIGQGMAIYLYNCLINPLFSFSDVVYNSMSKTDAAKLQVLQNNCICTCLKCDKLTSGQDLYSSSGIKPIHLHRTTVQCILLIKNVYKQTNLWTFKEKSILA